MAQVISPHQYYDQSGLPDYTGALGGAISRLLYRQQQRRAQDLTLKRIAAEDTANSIRQEAENRLQARQNRAQTQSDMEKAQAAFAESLKSLVGESASNLINMGADESVAGPPTASIATDNPMGMAVTDVSKAARRKAIIDHLGPEIGPAVANSIDRMSPVSVGPLVSGVTIPGMEDVDTGASVAPRRVPVKFQEDVAAEEQRAGAQKAAQVGAEEKARVAARGKQVEKEIDLGNKKKIYYTDGTVEYEPVGIKPKAPGAAIETGLPEERQARLLRILPEAGDWQAITIRTPSIDNETTRGGSKRALGEWAAENNVLLPDNKSREIAISAKATISDLADARKLLDDPSVKNAIGRYAGTVANFVAGGWIPGVPLPDKVRSLRTKLNRISAKERHTMYGSALTKQESKYAEGFLPAITQPLAQIGSALDEFEDDLTRAMEARFGGRAEKETEPTPKRTGVTKPKPKSYAAPASTLSKEDDAFLNEFNRP